MIAASHDCALSPKTCPKLDSETSELNPGAEEMSR